MQRPANTAALDERIDALVEAARVALELPGVSIVLLRGDSVLLARGYGFADVENGVPATEHTVYGIGSLSKQFAAAAVMKLVEQGRVGLDDPVHAHLPEFLETGTGIRIRHLLRQTSGLPDYGSFPEIVEIRRRADVEPAQFDLAGGIRLVGQAPRRFEPGEWWSYSGSNYLLLTAMVERATGRTFHDFVSETLLEPLGLRATHVCGLPDRGARARGYVAENGSFTVRPLARNTADAGAGGLCSSALEIALWKRALVGGRAVSGSSFRQMIEVAPVGAGFTPPYGFGLSLVQVAGRPAIWHTGVISGHTSVLAYLPEEDLTVAMLTNRRRADLHSLFLPVVRAALDLPQPVLQDLPVSAAQIDHASGTYDDYLFTISVFEDAGRLRAHISDMDLTLPLLFQGGNEFATAEPETFRFWFEPAGERAERVVFEWDEIRSYGRRVRAEPEAAPDGSRAEAYPAPHGHAQTPAFCETARAPAADPLLAQRSAQVDTLLAPWDRPGLPGAAVLVIHCGRIVHQRGYGVADISSGAPITAATGFDLGSISKPFTSLAILMLVEQQKLTLDQPISSIFPEAPAHWQRITVRHLLTHTAGLPEYDSLFVEEGRIDVDFPRSRHGVVRGYEPTSRDALAIVLRQPQPLFAPGTRHEYSNSGYVVLAQIVEAVSGVALPEFLRHHLFVPLGMTESLVYDERIAASTARATSYTRRGEELFDIDYTALNYIYGDGSIQSSIRDLYLWDQALHGERLVSQASLQQSFAPGRLNDGTAFDYGLGWNVNTAFGLRRAGHGGSWLGFKNMLMRYPDQQFTVVLLSNVEQFDREILASRIARLYLEDKMRFPEEIAVDPAALPPYVGSYRLGGEAGFVVTLRDGVLWLQAPNGSEHRLVPIALDTFVFHEVEDVTITFERDAAGQVRSLRRHQYITQYAERLH